MPNAYASTIIVAFLLPGYSVSALMDLIFRAVTNSKSLRFQGTLWLQVFLKIPSNFKTEEAKLRPEAMGVTVSHHA